jgi:lysophospholipase L1-like esterase
MLPADALRAPYLADYACAVREVAAKTSAALVDHFKDWESFEKNQWMAYLLSDALHPNECGHRLMNRSLLKTLGIWDEKSIVGRLLIPSPE